MAMLGAALLWLAAPNTLPASQDATITVPTGDPEMAAAIKAARTGLPVFFGHATAPGPDEAGYMIKYDLLPGTPSEFIWAEVIAHKGDMTTARLLNAPRSAGFAKGQQVTVRDREVIDWAYWRAGTLVGGATMRVLLARMTAAEARAMRDRFGW